MLTVGGESVTGAAAVEGNELSEAIIGAVVDEHAISTTDGVTRFQRHQAGPPYASPETGRATRRRRLSGDWSLRRPKPGGAG